MPAAPRSSPAPSPSQVDYIASSLKRRIAQLEVENEKIRREKQRKTPARETTLARGVLKVVSLHVPLKALVDESDKRIEMDDDELENLPIEQRREYYESFKCFRSLFGGAFLDRVLEHEDFLDKLKVWGARADEARGDDIKRLKAEVANWINTLDHLDVSGPNDPFSFIQTHTRVGRGFTNPVTGRLLCPIEYDWEDLDVRQKVQSFDPEFPTHEQYLVRALYEGYRGDPNDYTKGFLKSVLHVRAYKQIFTSLSSAVRYVPAGEGDEGSGEPSAKRRRTGKEPTKKNVASLLGMTEVTPRSIAYAAVLLHFSLTDTPTWNVSCDGFNYAIFYDFIVDYFEDRRLTSEEDAQSLLGWWNRQVFGQKFATSTPGATVDFKNRLAEQKVVKENKAKVAACVRIAARRAEARNRPSRS
ncbi:hypothetical protein AAF712_012503 [Marasmius tenuissimus]|uniref:Proteophosphoglycan ppg4 n=1 Tax=Marasmius tenuissimus TaxID=585030 RepID=A0ABR2ZJ01_9AGAR